MEKVASKTSKRRQSTATGHDSKPQAGDTELLGVYIARLTGRPCVTLRSLSLTDQIATLGYKQELRRHYSTIQIFAVAFSIMGLLPSIASTLAFSMPAGPVGMVWVIYFPRLKLVGIMTDRMDRVCNYRFRSIVLAIVNRFLGQDGWLQVALSLLSAWQWYGLLNLQT